MDLSVNCNYYILFFQLKIVLIYLGCLFRRLFLARLLPRQFLENLCGLLHLVALAFQAFLFGLEALALPNFPPHRLHPVLPFSLK